MSIKNLRLKRYIPSKVQTNLQWSSLVMTGSDCERFLLGQTTNSLSELRVGEGVLNARVDRTGKTQAVFFTLKSQSAWILLGEKGVADFLNSELNKFIIMDDVEIANKECKVSFVSSPNQTKSENSYSVIFAGVPGTIFLDGDVDALDKISDSEAGLLGFPLKGFNWDEGKLLTESPLHKSCVDLNKGCFLGQEVLAKVLNNRGPANYMAVIENKLSEGLALKNEEGDNMGKVLKVLQNGLSLVQISRKYAVKKRELNFKVENEVFSAVPNYLPFYEDLNEKKLSQEVYEYATDIFKSDENLAANWFERSLAINPENQDACESLGVCLGRLGQYQKGIDIMDELLKLNPDSVMAHTNKSLFLMKLGKIDEAEEEKSLATVAGFKQLGKQSKEKKLKEDQIKQEREELERKKGMFQQVLEIDEDDLIANYGMGEYYFRTEEFEQSVVYMEKTIDLDPGYSRAYLILGKSYLMLDNKEKAKNILEEGVKVAREKGELMPANEMQEKLLKI
jgi:folate-binding Fe-S cluster repair protein YgfZ/Tfp pilus assembly protein PilF